MPNRIFIAGNLLVFVLATCLMACHSQNKVTPPATTAPAALTTPAAAPKITVNDTQRIEYYSNGRPKLTAQLKDGKMDGPYQEFYENSQPKQIGMMAGGQKTGVWSYFDSTGKMKNAVLLAKDSVVMQLDTSDYTLVVHKVPAEHLQLKIPADWQLIEETQSPALIFAAEKKCDTTELFCPSISFTREDIKDEISFEDYIKLGHDMLKQSFPGYKLVAEGKMNIKGFESYQMEYKGNANGMKLAAVTTLFYRKGTVYLLTGISKDEPKGAFLPYRVLFKQISGSVTPM